MVSVYINQFDTSLLGQKVCKAKNIPIYKTVGEAVTLGGSELAVDGVVIVCEHGNYPTDLKGHWLLPRWWIYQQVIRVFEQSNARCQSLTTSTSPTIGTTPSGCLTNPVN